MADSGTLTFDPGASTQTVNVTVNPDALVEGMETFVVTLCGRSGPAIAVARPRRRILDPPGGRRLQRGRPHGHPLAARRVGRERALVHERGRTCSAATFTNPPRCRTCTGRWWARNDFNADGKPDILWRHAVSGENVVWFMNGTEPGQRHVPDPAALAERDWKMVGTGDFNVDGKPDILWRHDVSGRERGLVHERARCCTSGTFLTPPAFADMNWQMVGTGDFNGDGQPDILWRHATVGPERGLVHERDQPGQRGVHERRPPWRT